MQFTAYMSLVKVTNKPNILKTTKLNSCFVSPNPRNGGSHESEKLGIATSLVNLIRGFQVLNYVF